MHQLDAGRLGTREFTAFPHLAVEALFLLPILYAALNFGLRGSLTTAAWVAVLMSVDITLDLPGMSVMDQWAHYVELATLGIVAFVVGRGVEIERLMRARSEAAESRYYRLFETNRSPILVLNDEGTVSDANPSAKALLGEDVVGRPGATLLEGDTALDEQAGRVLSLPDGHDYRLDVVSLPVGTGDPSTQVILEDVTEERSEGRRATRYAQLVVQAEEDQRRRLARELHDEPLQLFLLLAQRLDSVSEIQGVPDAAADALRDARYLALDAAARLRTLARDLRPPSLDDLGLIAALSSLVADIEDEAGPAAELCVVGTETRLSSEVELGAFRIAQEAVRNALRHANASHVIVTVEFSHNELALTIADDGQGFSPESFDEHVSDRLGLLGMRERVRLLGGQFEVQSSPGGGAVVEARIPLDNSRQTARVLPSVTPGTVRVTGLSPGGGRSR
ncbi:MAG: ATP-binding protein [Hyphomicrobiales bacterium]